MRLVRSCCGYLLEESERRYMAIVLGALTGALGFLPLLLSLRLARRSTSTEALTIGMYGLAGVCVSFIILVVALVACGITAKASVLPFAVSETAVFLSATIVFVVYKNLLAKRRAPRE